MRATELRIGNLVENHNGIVEKVEGIYTTPDYIEVSAKTTVGTVEDFKPIPLTEKWLERFGFNKRLDGNYVHKEDYSLEVFFHNSGFEVMVDSCCKDHCKHVHTLQNLYFALTGEELTIKQD